MAEPEAAEHGIDVPVRLGPRVTHVEVSAQPVRDQALASAIERRRSGVVQGELALRCEQGRPPAGAGRQLDDLARDREAVQPPARLIELGRPGDIVERPAFVPAASQVPVVVLAGARLVVRDHLVVA